MYQTTVGFCDGTRTVCGVATLCQAESLMSFGSDVATDDGDGGCTIGVVGMDSQTVSAAVRLRSKHLFSMARLAFRRKQGSAKTCGTRKKRNRAGLRVSRGSRNFERWRLLPERTRRFATVFLLILIVVMHK